MNLAKKNPAKFSDSILQVIENYILAKLPLESTILDPFGGSGKIAKIKDNVDVKIHCNDIENGWKEKFPVDMWYHQDAEFLTTDCTFDAIITSPTYGNRMADHHNAKDASKRITYTHRYGNKLTEGNTGVMHFGNEYKNKHYKIFVHLKQLLKTNGYLMVNVSNFIRSGKEVDVVGWWQEMLSSIGYIFIEKIPIATPRMRYGANAKSRVDNEYLLIYKLG